MKKILIVILSLPLLFIIYLFFQGYKSQNMDIKSSLVDNKLGLCTEKPNCVSSFLPEDHPNYIAPLKVNSNLKQISFLLFPNLKVQYEKELYKYFTYKSSFFGFVDDIEILYKPGSKVFHFRSASRVGYSDLGANRKRIESMKEAIKKYVRP